MTPINIFHKTKSIRNHIRGFLFNNFFFKREAKGLYIAKNVQLWGQIKIGQNVTIGSNVSIYKKAIISDNVTLGENVELRSNRGNVITIGKNCTINRGSLIIGQVTIGDDCLIAPLCVIVGSNHVFSSTDKLIRKQGVYSKGIIVGNNVWIGTQVTILDGVAIGENSVIGAGSVVTKNISSNSVAVGNPCKVVKCR